jgi:hypothetical protein
MQKHVHHKRHLLSPGYAFKKHASECDNSITRKWILRSTPPIIARFNQSLPVHDPPGLLMEQTDQAWDALSADNVDNREE